MVWAAGSSTVFPFATRVAENFARKTGRPAPRVESLGTGGGIKLFCSGVGLAYPDVALASRPMKAGEYDDCRANGVEAITELKVGYDGIVVATAKTGADYDLQLADLYLALAAQTPQGSGFVRNPHRTWADVREGLPDVRIQVYGPPPTSGTRDAFNELGLEGGGKAVPQLAAIRKTDEDRFKSLAASMRRDGAWIDSGENDNAVVQTLTKTPGAMGVFGFSFLIENGDKVKAAKIGGFSPGIDDISNGTYPLSRSLYVYVKKAHLPITPGLKEFVAEFASDAASARGGYLQSRGMIPLTPPQHEANKQVAATFPELAKPNS